MRANLLERKRIDLVHDLSLLNEIIVTIVFIGRRFASSLNEKKTFDNKKLTYAWNPDTTGAS